MLKYIIKRILYIIPVMLGVIILVFLMKMVTPGDPVLELLPLTSTEEQKEEMREQLGLNDPIVEQFGKYVLGVVRGDLGTSYKTKQPVSSEIATRLPKTLTIAVWGILIAQVIGIPLGVVAAINQNRAPDNIVVVFTMLGASVPNFWLALMLVQWFSVNLGWLPSVYNGTAISWVLPITATMVNSIAQTARAVRTNMLEVVRQDYIMTARAKGQKEVAVIWNHAFRNTLIPMITAIGSGLGAMIGGTLIVEQVFAVPGIGKYISDAVTARNYPALQGGIIVLALLCCIINIIVDVAYTIADPRMKTNLITTSKKKKAKEAA